VSLDPTSVPAKWHVNPSDGLSRVHECDRQQTNDGPRYGDVGKVNLHVILHVWLGSGEVTSATFIDCLSKT